MVGAVLLWVPLKSCSLLVSFSLSFIQHIYDEAHHDTSTTLGTHCERYCEREGDHYNGVTEKTTNKKTTEMSLNEYEVIFICVRSVYAYYCNFEYLYTWCFSFYCKATACLCIQPRARVELLKGGNNFPVSNSWALHGHTGLSRPK